MTNNLYRHKPLVVEAMQWFPEVPDFSPSPDRFMETTVGDMALFPGYWLIFKDNKVCNVVAPDIFEKTYEKVESYISTYETHQADKEYTYIYVICGRKSWHYADDAFKGWTTIDFDSGDYTEVHTLRKKTLELTEEDKDIIKSYGEYQVRVQLVEP